MSFFIRKKQGQNGPGKGAPIGRGKGRKAGDTADRFGGKRRRKIDDEEILSDSDSGGDDKSHKKAVSSGSSDEEEETAQDKRLRLAKEYLAQIEVEEAERADDLDEASVSVADRLKQDILEQSGRLQKFVASRYVAPDVDEIKVCRGHQLPVTCVVITNDDKYVFSGSKDCSLIKWCLASGKKLKVIAGGRKGTEKKHNGHTATVQCLAVSSDSRFLASGDKNKLIMIWNPETCERLHQFTGHRDAVSGLAFRRGTHQLFSASNDRTIKIWNVDEMAYVETLFGHHDVITGIDSMTRERAVTSGGRDGSVRVWKVIEESQLVFHGHSGSIDCITLINEEHMVSGADDNSLAIWSLMKKKPVVLVPNAHGNGASGQNWITSVASLCHTDLVASGSQDGHIHLWQCSENFKSLTPLFTIPLAGFINGLKFSSSGDHIVAGVGQEHRLGRWWRLKEAKNSVCIIPLRKKAEEPGYKPKVSLIQPSRRRPGRRRGSRK